MKSAVLYYSRSGKTRQVADQVIKKFHSDEIFIEPEEAYGNYVSSLIRFGREKVKDTPPKSKTRPINPSDYDILFLGFPVWGGVMPQFVQEYVKSCHIEKTMVIPFATAGSNGRERALNHVKTLVSNCNEKLYFYTNLFTKENPKKWISEVERWINTSGSFQ